MWNCTDSRIKWQSLSFRFRVKGTVNSTMQLGSINASCFDKKATISKTRCDLTPLRFDIKYRRLDQTLQTHFIAWSSLLVVDLTPLTCRKVWNPIQLCLPWGRECSLHHLGFKCLKSWYFHAAFLNKISSWIDVRNKAEAGCSREHLILIRESSLNCSYPIDTTLLYCTVELSRAPFKAGKLPNGGVGLLINYNNEDTLIPAEVTDVFLFTVIHSHCSILYY